MSAPADAQAFAERWISDWNLKDVEAVLAHFSEDAVFTSPRAKLVVGSPRLLGKASLREYWNRAVERIETIQFTLDYVIKDSSHMAIVYAAELNGKRVRSVEFLDFGEDGLIHRGEAMHGIEL